MCLLKWNTKGTELFCMQVFMLIFYFVKIIKYCVSLGNDNKQRNVEFDKLKKKNGAKDTAVYST